jgi:hypothetical protein
VLVGVLLGVLLGEHVAPNPLNAPHYFF